VRMSVRARATVRVPVGVASTASKGSLLAVMSA